MRRYVAIFGLVSLGLGSGVALAACGGGGTPETPISVSSTTPSASLSKAEFISQADGICQTANTQIADIAAAGEGITRAADVADIRQGVVTDIRALGTPVGDTSSGSISTDPTATAPVNDTSTFPSSSSSTGSSTTSTGTSTGSTSTGNDLADFLSAMEAEVKAGQKIDLASQRGQSTAAAEAELTSAKDSASTAGSSYGFLECGTEGTASSGTSTSSSSSSSSPGTSVAPSTSAPPAVSPPSTSGGSSGSSGTSTGNSGGTSGSGGGVGPG
jgi:hypothetical protein